MKLKNTELSISCQALGRQGPVFAQRYVSSILALNEAQTQLPNIFANPQRMLGKSPKTMKNVLLQSLIILVHFVQNKPIVENGFSHQKC